MAKKNPKNVSELSSSSEEELENGIIYSESSSESKSESQLNVKKKSKRTGKFETKKVHALTTLTQRLNFEKPYKKLRDLIKGRKYRITSATKVETKYGPSILVELNNEFKAYLPPLYTSKIQDYEIVELKQYYLIFKGFQKTRRGFDMHDLEFQEARK